MSCGACEEEAEELREPGFPADGAEPPPKRQRGPARAKKAGAGQQQRGRQVGHLYPQ